MANYEEARVKITNTQLSRSKSTAKNKTGTTLRITKKKFQGEKLPDKLFLASWLKTKIKNAFAGNMSTDMKLSKVKLAKVIQSGRLVGVLLGKLAGPFMEVAAPLAKNVLAPLATMASASAIDGAIQRKMCGRGVIMTSGVGVVRAGKGIALVISNEGMDGIIRVIKLLENLGVSIDGVSQTAKHEIKKQEVRFLGMLSKTLGASMLRNMLTERGALRAGKGAMKAERGYNNFHKNF